jgi:hypothetical protein
MRILKMTHVDIHKKGIQTHTGRARAFNGMVVFSQGWGAVAVIEYLVFVSLYPQVSKYFLYMKFTYEPVGFAIHPVFVVLSAILGITSVGVIARVSLVITLVPTLVLAAFQVIAPQVTILTVLFQAFLVIVDRQIGYPRMRPTNQRDLNLCILIFGLPACGLVIIFADLISFKDLLDVYGNRELYSEQVASSSLPLTYTKLIAKVLLVALAIKAYSDIRYAFIAVAVSFLFYLIMSSKFTLFIPVLVWTFPFVMTRAYIITCVFILLYLLNILTTYTDYHLLTVSLTRRAFLLVPRLNDIYYNIFSDFGAAYFTTSVLSFLAEPEMVLAKRASLYFWGDLRTNANAGAVGSGLAQLGYLGPFIFAGIYLFLANLNPGYRRNDPVSLACLSIFIFTGLGISDISTTLFMHGGIVFCILYRFTSQSLGIAK